MFDWLARQPHCAAVQGSIPGGSGLPVWNLHVYPMPAWVFSGYYYSSGLSLGSRQGHEFR